MKKLYLLMVSVFLSFAASAQADNGVGVGDVKAVGPAFLGPIDTQIGGPWLEFQFGAASTWALPCTSCAPSSGGNSVFLTSTPPWTFTVGTFGGATLTATDAFLYGDIFDIYDNAGYVGTTSAAVNSGGSCGSDPAICYPDPLSSSGAFPMAVGNHAIDIWIAASPFGAGAAYFRVDLNAIFVDMDIKFCSNPNAFNTKKKGGFPVTIFGSATFDVNAIDLDTLQLCNDAAGTVCTPAGLKSFSTLDRGDPTTDLGAANCELVDVDGDGTPDIELDTLNPDGFLDLDAVFYAQEVSTLIGAVSKGDPVGPLYLVGYLLDGTPITTVPVNDIGVDWLAIKK